MSNILYSTIFIYLIGVCVNPVFAQQLGVSQSEIQEIEILGEMQTSDGLIDAPVKVEVVSQKTIHLECLPSGKMGDTLIQLGFTQANCSYTVAPTPET